MGDVTDLSQLHGRGHRRPRVRQAQEGDRTSQALGEARDHGRRHRPTTRVGYFVRPTVIESSDPTDAVFNTEYFGPILSVHVYDDARLRAGRSTRWSRSRRTPSPARSSPRTAGHRVGQRAAAVRRRQLLHQRQADRRGRRPAAVRRRPGLRHQRQGRRRANLMRWTSPRSIKETFVPPKDYRYPHMG